MLNDFKKSLRKFHTDAEGLLWYYLRNRYLQGLKFRRQHVLFGYIVDFVCLEARLIIELDGSQHMKKIEYDFLRTKTLEDEGFYMLRFWNNDVLSNIEGVLNEISQSLNIPLTRRAMRVG